MIKKAIKGAAANIGLLMVAGVSVFPFLYMFFMSFRSTINAYDLSFSLKDMTLMQYEKIFAVTGFSRYIFNSIFVAAAGVLLSIAVCSLAGYAFAKMNFRGREKLFLLIVLTMLVPSEVIIVPLFLIAKGLGWLNTYRALILPLPTAFGVFIMRQAILAVPQDLVSAAKLDGCGNIKIFFKVILPMTKTSILSLSIFTFVGAWNNFIWPLVVSTTPEMKTLPLALSMMKTQYNTDVGLTMACAVINFLPPFLFYVFMQGRFKEGLALSGLKG
ncbi:MAG: carbohydrate ABC transporter permease [Eubacteriales bacterium]|nr:carbohydrate ABC transporter permease [Eubacteriales bacterium]